MRWDYPYYEVLGFPAKFIEAERFLCAYDCNGELLREPNGIPVLECICGNIIRGRFDPKFPFFTENGSFWTNCTTDLLSSTTEEDRGAHTRNRCNTEGYESVALIPLRAEYKNIGLLQLNDKRKGMFNLEMIQFFDSIGSSIGIALTRKNAAAKLEKWAHIFEHAEWGIVVCSADGKTLEMMNPAFARMHGYSVEELTGRPIVDVFAPVSRDELPGQIRTAHKKGHNTFESKHIRKDGTIFPVLVDVTTVKDKDENVLYRAVNVKDITEQKKTEEKLRASLTEKETLLNEIHHRVKNNLNVVIGLLNLQSKKMKNPQAVTAFKESVNRIHAMALVHKKLYESENFSLINFKEYIQTMIEDMFQACKMGDQISLNLAIEDVALPWS
ncbi:PAS domain S-box protein [candidate division KSB1 bacterium]|nr:PAS domain S-box protein [candidate division KSB1 bacterium]